MKARSYWALGVATITVFATLLGLNALGPTTTSSDPHSLRPDDAGVIGQGARVYETHCANCHGARLEGQPNWRERGADGRLPAPPHDATGHTWHHPDEMLFRLTKFGLVEVAKLKDYQSAMPVYKGVLSDEEIVAVLSWIKAQWPAEVRERQDEMNRQAQR